MTFEERLRQRKINLKQIKQENETLLKTYKKYLEENKFETLNDKNISNNAEVTITILEALNLQTSDYSLTASSYALISLENKEQVSNVKENTNNPVWNEDFTL